MAFFNGFALSFELLTLWVSSFISATLFPGGSELLLAYYLQSNPNGSWYYFFSATLGNSAGAVVTYFMGYYLSWGRDTVQRKHPKKWLLSQRYGAPILLLSWVPIIGDFFPLAAGWLKLPILPSILFIMVGKGLRYWLIMNATLHLSLA